MHTRRACGKASHIEPLRATAALHCFTLVKLAEAQRNSAKLAKLHEACEALRSPAKRRETVLNTIQYCWICRILLNVQDLAECAECAEVVESCRAVQNLLNGAGSVESVESVECVEFCRMVLNCVEPDTLPPPSTFGLAG